MKSLAAIFWLQAGPEGAAPFGMLVPMLLIFLIFYFLLIRPQQRRQRDQEAMLKALEKGDDVVTAGGLHGKVVGVTDDVLTLEIAALKGERVRVKVNRAKIESASNRRRMSPRDRRQRVRLAAWPGPPS
jgi:preprotein translocase subunit YajC